MSYILATDRVALAIRQGKQTQDRRPVKGVVPLWMVEHGRECTRFAPWQPGDLLYVREAHRVAYDSDDAEIAVQYRADGEIRPLFDDVDHRHVTPRRKWRPNIHHCKAHARTWVRVKRVWVERVRDISDEDAVAEAVPCWICGRPFDGLSEEDCQCFHSTGMDGRCSAAESFEPFWESLYPGSWERNNWVWCCEFEREEQG